MNAGAPPKTFIADLRPGRYAALEAKVTKLDPIRRVELRVGRTTPVRNRILRDGTGERSLVLWDPEVEPVSEGDKVRLVEVRVKDYRGKPETTLGRTARLEKLWEARERDPTGPPSDPAVGERRSAGMARPGRRGILEPGRREYRSTGRLGLRVARGRLRDPRGEEGPALGLAEAEEGRHRDARGLLP